MITSSFIDFSDKIVGTLSCFDLNIKVENRLMVAETRGFSITKLAIPEQIHSSTITCIDTPGNYKATDGLLTDNTEIILTLKVADCVPVYISNSKIIGLLHAGWRGTSQGIVSKAVNKMLAMGAKENNIHVFLGPAIGFCCYEVDKEVADQFSNITKKKLKNGKWKVGLREEIFLQLTDIGISKKNIKTSNICTFEGTDYHSYRREGGQKGHMFAFMSIKS